MRPTAHDPFGAGLIDDGGTDAMSRTVALRHTLQLLDAKLTRIGRAIEKDE
jgi:hypothetical protein